MLPQERLKKIEELLRQNGSIIVSNLSAAFEVSEETIRRDLEKLSKTIKFKRVRGGAFLYETSDTEVPVRIREKIYIKEKQIIGEKSVTFIEDRDTIMLDSSTTALYIAKQLNVVKKKVTVITNSVAIANELMDNTDVNLVSLGGRLRKSTKSYIGYMATDQLENLHADKAFVSCTSVEADHGVFDSHGEEARVRKAMLENAKEKYLIADYTKFEATAMNKISDIESLNYIIVDHKLPDAQLSGFADKNIKIICCESK